VPHADCASAEHSISRGVDCLPETVAVDHNPNQGSVAYPWMLLWLSWSPRLGRVNICQVGP
jgi:hypothetical protein